MIYIALLRGINVGGKNKVDMKLLKTTFEHVGMNDVVTYINTGNIIFRSNTHDKTELSRTLEEAILADFALAIKVVVRSYADIQTVIQALPDSWANNDVMKSDVLFLWDEIDNESVMDKLALRQDIDRVKYVPGAILWSIDRENANKSGMKK